MNPTVMTRMRTTTWKKTLLVLLVTTNYIVRSLQSLKALETLSAGLENRPYEMKSFRNTSERSVGRN